MKILSVLAMTAALMATGASAQGVSDRGVSDRAGVQQRDSVTTDRSGVRHPTKAKERIARPRGSGSFASVPAAGSRAASSAFDGNWSVLIQTQIGACDPAYRYGVQIQNGEVFNAGGEPIALEGRVAPSGAVRVSVAAGGQEAHGAGRLSRTSGGGTWQGQGSAGTCAGTWVAERRG
jgi:hypothetical protein